MLARCARCQGTFTTDRYGRQSCPHCGSELILPDPNAPQAPPPPGGTEPPAPPSGAEGMSPPPPAGGGWAPLPPPPAPPPPPEGGIPSPFADRRGRGFFGAYFQTWKLVAIEPQKFFTHVRIDQQGAALGFGILSAVVGVLVGGLLALPLQAAQFAQIQKSLGDLPANESEVARQMIAKLAFLFQSGLGIGLNLALVLIGLFLAALVVHLMLLMLQGAQRGFGATLTVVAYSYGVHLLDAIPSCGSLVAIVWQLVILIAGLAAVHRTSTGKAALGVILPGILCCCCLCVILWLVAMAVGTAVGAAAGGTANL